MASIITKEIFEFINQSHNNMWLFNFIKIMDDTCNELLIMINNKLGILILLILVLVSGVALGYAKGMRDGYLIGKEK